MEPKGSPKGAQNNGKSIKNEAKKREDKQGREKPHRDAERAERRGKTTQSDTEIHRKKREDDVKRHGRTQKETRKDDAERR